MRDISLFFSENDHFAKHSGITLLEVQRGYAKVQMDIQPMHFNGAGTVHGGAIFTLADFAFAVAANSHGQLALAINTSITFINPAHEGCLFAEARELSVNRRLGTYEVQVRNHANLLIAQFQGTAYRKKENTLQMAKTQPLATE